MFDIRIGHFFCIPKKKVKSMFTLTKKLFSGLPNLGSQIRCAQDCNTAVQMDLKYPLQVVQMEAHKAK